MGQLTCLQQFADFNRWCRANRAPWMEIFAPERLKPSLLKTQTGPHKGVMTFCRHLSSRGAMQRKEEKGKKNKTNHQTTKRKYILLTQLKYTASASELTLNIYYLYLTWVKPCKSNSCISSGHHEGCIYMETPPGEAHKLCEHT